jgi:ATP-dependent DNA helicase RecG
MQVAVMAPTELLAEQHARTLAAWADASGRRAALLTASTPRGARESTLTLLAAGRVDLLIGTHALLAERVGFHRLGLVIIDEQHRFGVAQRATLRDKGGAPHLLVMTATPIPRTYALTLYGDLDCTTLDELPPGRTPADTRILSGTSGRGKAYAALRARLDAGQQGYVVCPLVEESEALEVADAVATYERLTAELPGVAVGLVHGRLTAAERDEVMGRFRAGEVRLLVATTVVEVGVDVPAAQAMVIEGADRFGLAQLHQLRGRIGRAPGAKPLCLLLTDARSGSDATRRLDVMAESADGFVIAEEDLKLRGPGEVYGTRQAGMPRLQYANIARDLELLRMARSDAFELLAGDPTLVRPEHTITRSVLQTRWAEGRLFGEEAG